MMLLTLKVDRKRRIDALKPFHPSIFKMNSDINAATKMPKKGIDGLRGKAKRNVEKTSALCMYTLP